MATNIWISLTSSNKVIQINELGSLIGGPFTVGTSPTRLALDYSGNVWVPNSNSANITKLSPTGSTLGTFSTGAGSDPESVALDTSGNAWIALYGTNKVLRLNSSGGTVATYNVGTSPFDIAVDAFGTAWVACNGSNNVYSISQTGTISGPFSVGTGCWGIAVDKTGDVWTANAHGGTGTLTKLSNTGSFIFTVTGFSEPQGIIYDYINNVMWVSDLSTGYVAEVTLSGTATLHAISTVGTPSYLCIDNQGSLWIPNLFNNEVTKGVPPSSSTGFSFTGEPYAAAVIPPPITTFRRTLSQYGSRAGSRQAIGGF
jgi:streptogramin lyase